MIHIHAQEECLWLSIFFLHFDEGDATFSFGLLSLESSYDSCCWTLFDAPLLPFIRSYEIPFDEHTSYCILLWIDS